VSIIIRDGHSGKKIKAFYAEKMQKKLGKYAQKYTSKDKICRKICRKICGEKAITYKI